MPGGQRKGSWESIRDVLFFRVLGSFVCPGLFLHNQEQK